jgi:hypothetical protein
VTFDGGATVLQRGICWSSSSNPTTDDTCTTDGMGTGVFTSFASGMQPDTTYHFRAYATNTAGDGYGEDRQFTTTAPNLYRLTVQVGGNGYGSVSSSVGGIGFAYPTLSSATANIARGSDITLTAVAASGSTAAWYGNCDSTGGTSTTATCTINSMNATKTVQASFVTPCAIGPVRNSPTSYFDAIMTGYNVAVDGGMMQMQALSFTENLNFNRSVAVTLQGGYDCGFSTNGGWTTLNSGMTVSAGSVTIDRLIVR